MSLINFNNKVFTLNHNTDNGTTNAETIFYYQQKDTIVTADFSGGSVLYGKIIAIHMGDYLDMIYQMITATNELKSGKAIAKISLGKNDKIQLNLDWEWLIGSGNTGTSIYNEK
jgi:hypothetical protein